MTNTAFTRRRFLSLASVAIPAAAEQSLAERWREIAATTDGTVGAAALPILSGTLTSLNGDECFPLASVCKLPIAMNILALVDEGQLAMNAQVEVLGPDVYSGVSDIAKRWPAQTRFPLHELVYLMVSESDNTAVETLFRIGGGSIGMSNRFRAWRIAGIRVDRSERQCSLDRNGVVNYPPPNKWTDKVLNKLTDEVPDSERYSATLRYLTDPRDTGTPNDTARLLARLFRGELLSNASTSFLIKSLKSTNTFPTRLKGLLPPGTIVAHKTGSTGTVNGITAATNDSGVIFLPNGGELAVSVYVKASTRIDAERDRVIARIARKAFDSAYRSSTAG